MAKNTTEATELIVFISYSRSDVAFADRLVTALEGRHIKCLIDRRDLDYGEQWQAELRDFIRQSDTAIFVVSPRSMASTWCRWEAAEVTKLAKRSVPIVLEAVNPKDLPPDISAVHLMPFDTNGAFDAQVDQLERVLLTDRAWIKEQTRLSGLALQWDASVRKRDGLLRGSELAEAEAWKSRPTKGKLTPDSLVEAFISESRADAIRSQRMRMRISMAITIGALVLSGVAVWQGWRAVQNAELARANQSEALKQRDIAVKNEQLAKTQRDQALLSESRFLAESARQVTEQDKDPATGLALALEALPDQQSDDEVTRDRPFWAPAEMSLDGARRQLREQIVLAGSDEVKSVAVMPDGSRIVTGSINGSAGVWDAQTGTQLVEIDTDRIRSVAVTPDSARVITGSGDGVARIWNAKTGAEIAELKGHTGGISSVAVTSDGSRIITGSDDKTARIWDMRTGVELVRLNGHTEGLTSVAVMPDGEHIVTGSFDNTGRIWDAKTGAELVELKGHTAYLTAVAVTPNGERVITSSVDKTARIWDAKTGAELTRLTGHVDRVTSVAVTPDGTRIITGGGSLIGSADNTVRIWDAKTGAQLAVLNGHTKEINSVAVMPDGLRLVTGSNDTTARVWSIKIGAELIQLQGHTDVVNHLAVTPDGSRIITGSRDKTARIWDARTGAAFAELKGHTGGINSLVVTPDGTHIVTGSEDKTARIWDAVTGAALVELKGHTDAVTSVAVTPDGTRIITGSTDKTARIWNATTGAALGEIEDKSGAIRHLAVTPDGTRFVTTSGKTARIWDTKTGAALAELTGHTDTIDDLTISPDGTRIVTGSADRTARVWDAKTGAELFELKDHSFDVIHVVVTPDNSRIITITGGAFGKNLRKVRIWDARTGAELRAIDDHPGLITGVALTPDGGRIVTAASSIYDAGDETIRVWDVNSGAQLAAMQGHAAIIAAVMVTPDGTRIVTGSADKTARVWALFPTSQTLVAETKRLAPRCLTAEQRRRFHLSPMPPSWCKAKQKWPFDTITSGKDAFQAQHWSDAIAAFRQAIAFDQSKSALLSQWLALAYNAAAYSTFLDVELKGKANETLNSALAEANEAIALMPDASFLDTRGQIYLALGRNNEALADLDKAISLGVSSATTYFARGSAEERKGNPHAAITDYSTALQQKVSNDDYENAVRGEARDRLKALASAPSNNGRSSNNIKN